MQINREMILDTAIGILREYGLTDLTMRRLARALDVAPGALYWYFPSKQALLGGVADVMMEEVLPADGAAPQEYAQSFFDALTSLRDGAEITLAALSADTLNRGIRQEFLDVCGPHGPIVFHFLLGAALDYQGRTAFLQAKQSTGFPQPPDITSGVYAILR